MQVSPPMSRATPFATRVGVRIGYGRVTRDQNADGQSRRPGADVQMERDRNDASLSQLHEPLAQLIAPKPTRRPAAKKTAAKKWSAPSS